jgi:hypothetical protein
MLIALVGPGILSIPPVGFGAVEILINDYAIELNCLGHNVDIINPIRNSPKDQENPTTDYCRNLIYTLNSKNYDFIHIHYDCLYHIMVYLKCKTVGITSHYPYIDNLNKHEGDGYKSIFNFLTKQFKFYNFVLADKDINKFIENGAYPQYIKKINNGIDSSIFNFTVTPLYDKTIYLGKISTRKNQSKYQYLKGVDFVGGIEDYNFNNNNNNTNYLGEWTREKIHNELTNYTNLILLSDGEADALVIKEALICGLGIVVNRTSAENLDLNNNFITIIKDEYMDDLIYIQKKIEENKDISKYKREIIRNYGIYNFDIKNKVVEYVKILNSIIT